MSLATSLILASVALLACLTLIYVTKMALGMSQAQTASSVRMAQAAETAQRSAGETALMAYQEATKAGLMALARAAELAEATGARSQEVLRDSQETIRHLSSLLLPVVSPRSDNGSSPEHQVLEQMPWEEIPFGAETRENLEDRWPPPPPPPSAEPPPAAGADGWTVVRHPEAAPAWSPPTPPPDRPENLDPDLDLDQRRIDYERARGMDPALQDPNP